jgi:hypothetical protein
MLLPTPMLIFLILYSALSSIAAGPDQNGRVPPNCGILRRTDECNVQQCIAAGARCMSNAQGTWCVQRLEQSGMQPALWKSGDSTQNGCRGCYCGKVESQRQQRKLAAEQAKPVAEQKSKVKEHEMVGGDCTMTSRNLGDICYAARCFQDGISCRAIHDGRCYMHDRATGMKMLRLNETLPATCMPCKCTRAGDKLVQDHVMPGYDGREQRVLEAAQKLSLKRKAQEHDMSGGNCTMISRNLRDSCYAVLCSQEGFRCLPVSNGRCYLHSRDTGKRISPTYFALLPASCQPCKCTNALESKARGSSGSLVASPLENDLAEASLPAKASKKLKVG